MLTRDIIPIITVEQLAGVAVVIIIIGLAVMLSRWKKVLPPGFMSELRKEVSLGKILQESISYLLKIIAINKGLFNERWRQATHLMMFWGFIGLAVTTTWAYIVNPSGNYRPIYEPYRILGNISGIVLLIGSTIAIVRMIALPRFRRNRKRGDLYFLITLWLTTITGFTTQYFREIAYRTAGQDIIAAQMLTINYWLHFILIGLLLVTAPFSQFLHAITTPLLRLVENLGNKITPKMPVLTPMKGMKGLADIRFIQQLYEKKTEAQTPTITKQSQSIYSEKTAEETRQYSIKYDEISYEDVKFVERLYKQYPKK